MGAPGLSATNGGRMISSPTDEIPISTVGGDLRTPRPSKPCRERKPHLECLPPGGRWILRSKRRREPSGSQIISLLKYGLGLHPSLSKTPFQPNGNHITRMLPPPRIARHLPPGGRQSSHPRPTDETSISTVGEGREGFPEVSLRALGVPSLLLPSFQTATRTQTAPMMPPSGREVDFA